MSQVRQLSRWLVRLQAFLWKNCFHFNHFEAFEKHSEDSSPITQHHIGNGLTLTPLELLFRITNQSSLAASRLFFLSHLSILFAPAFNFSERIAEKTREDSPGRC